MSDTIENLDTNFVQKLYATNTCIICGQQFETGNHLQNHLRNVHNMTTKITKKYKRGKSCNFMLDYFNIKFWCFKCGKRILPRYKKIKEKDSYVKYWYIAKYCEKCNRKHATTKSLNTEYREKMKQTMIKKYGKEFYSQTTEWKEKMIQLNNKKYGKDWFMETQEFKEKSKQTMFKNFGVTNPAYSEKIREKAKQTTLKNFGVEYPIQNPEIYNKVLQNSLKVNTYKETELMYQGTYEKHFLDYCNSLNVQIKNGLAFEYYDKNNKKHVYYSDFYLPEYNLIIEIKSWYWLNKWKNKQQRINSVRNAGYNFLLIVDKNYQMFNKLIK